MDEWSVGVSFGSSGSAFSLVCFRTLGASALAEVFSPSGVQRWFTSHPVPRTSGVQRWFTSHPVPRKSGVQRILRCTSHPVPRKSGVQFVRGVDSARFLNA